MSYPIPGNPGYPPGTAAPPPASAPTWPPQQGAPAAPAPSVPGGWQPQPGGSFNPGAPPPSPMASGFQPGAPAPMQGAPAPGIDLSAHIQPGDTRFPAWLHGKTLGEAAQLLGTVTEGFNWYYRTYGPPGRQQPGAPAPQQGAPVPPQQPGQPGAAARPNMFSPEGIAQVMNQVLDQRLGPLEQRLASAQVPAIQGQMRQAFPDFGQYEADVVANINNMDPAAKTNPEIWTAAYYYIKGQRLSQPGAGRQQVPSNGHPGQAPGAPAQQPNWFTEAPSGPVAPLGQGQPDPRVGYFAQQMGVNPQEAYQWTGGNVPDQYRQPRVAGAYGEEVRSNGQR